MYSTELKVKVELDFFCHSRRGRGRDSRVKDKKTKGEKWNSEKKGERNWNHVEKFTRLSSTGGAHGGIKRKNFGSFWCVFVMSI